MSILGKKNTAKLADYPTVVETEARLAEFQAQHTACIHEINALETELHAGQEKDLIKLKARGLVEARPELAGQVEQKLDRLQKLREQRAVLEEAVKLQQSRAAAAKAQARRDLVVAVKPAHVDQVRRHVEAVLAAVQSAAELQRWQAAQDVSDMLFPATFYGVNNDVINDDDCPVARWLRELIREGLLKQNDPLLKETLIPKLKL